MAGVAVCSGEAGVGRPVGRGGQGSGEQAGSAFLTSPTMVGPTATQGWVRGDPPSGRGCPKEGWPGPLEEPSCRRRPSPAAKPLRLSLGDGLP